LASGVVSRKTHFKTFLSPLALTLLTTLLGFIDTGPFNTAVALILAVKAGLIATFFMHALYESSLVGAVTASRLIWFPILLSLTLSDYVSRDLVGTVTPLNPVSPDIQATAPRRHAWGGWRSSH